MPRLSPRPLGTLPLAWMLTSVFIINAPGCGGDDGSGGGDGAGLRMERPRAYLFPSRFGGGGDAGDGGRSSVSYSGQVFRHLLIDRLKSHLDGLTARVDDGSLAPAAGAGEVVAELDFYYRFDSEVAGELPHGKVTDPPVAMPGGTRWDDVSSGKDLSEKLAGNDPTGQHQTWDQGFIGWPEDGVTSPESLVERWFSRVQELVVARVNGTQGEAPGGGAIARTTVSAQGHDYAQLLQKFLLGAVAYSQGTDDYLDDATPDKGLHQGNAEPDKEGAPYTSLEHAWDEGFGYYGASATNGEPRTGCHDADADGTSALVGECAWGHAVNADKRDRGSAADAKTTFSDEAFAAFLDGRTVIANAGPTLTDAERAALIDARDRAVAAWEKAISATVVHYVNEVLADMDASDAADDSYSFDDHAKHWSELKGFALGLQFNPRSALDAAEFAALHGHLGQAPALPGAASWQPYRQALLDARALLGTAYGFADANVQAW